MENQMSEVVGPILDKIGQEIKPGCYVAYGHLMGNSAGLRIGKVMAVKSEIAYKYYRDITVYRITVRGIDDDWDYDRPKLNKRDGTLEYPNRILVLNPKTLPGKYRELLDPIPLMEK